MGKPSDTHRKWLAELGALGGGGGTLAALLAEPSVDVGAGPIATALGEQSVQLAGGAKGTLPPLGGGKPAGSQATAASESLPKKAKVTPLGGTKLGAVYDFGRPITREQAAQVIFVDGKVPSEVKLEPGPGKNSWTLQAFHVDDWGAAIKKMKAHAETSTPGKAEVEKEWSDGPSKAPKPEDLKKNLGFWVNKTYDIDIGQLPHWEVRKGVGVKQLKEGEGVGYEVIFDKAMTEKEVRDTLFANNTPKEDIMLRPMGGPTTTFWIVEIIGAFPFKLPAARAFVYDPKKKKSTTPGVPESIRVHIDNHTVSKDAVKHPPDVYVWEKDGYIVRVKTDGKGKYEFETTKISHGEKGDQMAMRYYMIEKGMRQKEAWEEFVKDSDEIAKTKLQAAGSVTGSRWTPMPRIGVTPKSAIKTPSRGGKAPPGAPKGPNTNVSSPPPPPNSPPKSGGSGGSPGNNTIVAHPPPMPKPAPGTKPAPVKMTGGGPQPPAAPPKSGSGNPANPKGANTPPSKPPPKKPDSGGTKDDVYTPPPGGKGDGGKGDGGKGDGGKGDGGKKGDDRLGQKMPVADLIVLPPDHMKFKIKTAKGEVTMSAGDYRTRVANAQAWIKAQNIKEGRRAGDSTVALHKKAQEKFGLDNGWDGPLNQITHGKRGGWDNPGKPSGSGSGGPGGPDKPAGGGGPKT